MTEVVGDVVSRPRALVPVWGTRLFLAAVLVYVGLVKLPDDAGMWVRLFERIGVGQWFRYFTGLVEIAGGILMLVPRTTIVAVALVASTMMGALVVHATVTGFGPATAAVCALLMLSLAVGRSYMRT